MSDGFCPRCGGVMVRDAEFYDEEEAACLACGHREYGRKPAAYSARAEARRQRPFRRKV